MEQWKKRSKRMVDAAFQVRLVGTFVGLAAVAMFLQFLFMGTRLVGALEELEGPGGQLAQEVPAMLFQVFVLSLVALLPIVFFLGIALTLRIAGPLHRFRSFLAAVARGEQVEPCVIRAGDQLQDLCDAINVATEPLRVSSERGVRPHSRSAA